MTDNDQNTLMRMRNGLAITAVTDAGVVWCASIDPGAPEISIICILGIISQISNLWRTR